MSFLSLAVSFIAGLSAYYIVPFLPISTLVFYILMLMVLCRFKGSAIFFCALCMIAGFCYSHIRTKPYSDIESLLGKRVSLTFVCVECNKGHLVIREEHILDITEAGSENPIRVKGIRAFANTDATEDSLYKASGFIAKDAFYLNPGFNQHFIPLYIDEIINIGTMRKGLSVYLRSRVNAKIDDVLSQESAAFVKAIVTGYRSEMPTQIREAFNRTGLAHILSISGAHFGLLLYIAFKFLRLVFYIMPERLLVRITLYATPTKVSALLTAPLMLFYLLLSSMNYPALRAFIMIVFLLLGLLLERKRYLPHSLMLAALIITLIEPASVVDLSFQLSFLSVLSIAVVFSFFQRGDEDLPIQEKSLLQKTFCFFKESILITFAATLGTALLVAYHFHYFSLMSPISNLLITPFIGFVLLPMSLVSSMIYLLAGWFPFAYMLDALTKAMLWTVSAFSTVQWASMPFPSFPLAILMIGVISTLLCSFFVFQRSDKSKNADKGVFWKVIGLMIAPYILVVCYFTCSARGLSVTFLDVGQGDSAVIELPDRKTIVVDTGKNGFVLSQYLRYRGILKIDALAISHPQMDHAGGLFRILMNFQISEIWDNGKVLYPQGIGQGITVRHLSRGDVVTGDGYRMLVLHPHENYQPDNNPDNNYSLVLQLISKGTSFLFTGDIEKDAMFDLMHTGSNLRSKVLKFPHHGSVSSLDEDFISLLSPEFVVISSGRLNRYGFPHQATLKSLEMVRVFRTDIDGAVRFKETGSGELTVMTAREFMPKRVVDKADEWDNLKRLFYAW